MPYSHPQPIDRHNALKEIRHLFPGALLLAGAAGYINTVGLGFFRTPVSHMTGAVSHLGVDLATGVFVDASTSATIIVGFLMGSIAAGLLVGAKDLLPSRKYGAALLGEATLLALAYGFLAHNNRFGLPLVAAACGLQNSTTSSYYGLIIRTTHVTGIVTDIGAMIGHWLRHREISGHKLLFLCAVFLAFGVGGFVGALSYARFGVASLLLVGIGFAVAGITLWMVAHHGLFTKRPANHGLPSWPESRNSG